MKFSFEIVLGLSICGNNLVPLSIGPATNWGKKQTNKAKSKKVFRFFF